MTKSLSWFPFDPAKYFMGRISRMPLDAQGGFIRLCCIYWTKECVLLKEDAELEVGVDVLEALIRHKIIKVESEFVFISFLKDAREVAMTTVESAQKAGKRSAEIRKKQAEEAEKTDSKLTTSVNPTLNQPSTPVERPLNEPSTSAQHIDREIDREIDKVKTTSLIVADDAFNRKHAKALIADNLFLGVAAMNNKVNKPDKVKDYIVSFHEHLAQEGKEHEKFTDFRKHFNNWLRIQISQGIQPTHRYDQH
jgi:hypothetical protein